jgi:hypothetical protein
LGVGGPASQPLLKEAPATGTGQPMVPGPQIGGAPHSHDAHDIADSHSVSGTLSPAPQTGLDIIRELKLKILRRHYEKTLDETIQLEKDALLAAPEERPRMEATATALRTFLAKLEADLLPLTGQPTPAREAAIPAIPGLDIVPTLPRNGRGAPASRR